MPRFDTAPDRSDAGFVRKPAVEPTPRTRDEIHSQHFLCTICRIKVSGAVAGSTYHPVTRLGSNRAASRRLLPSLSTARAPIQPGIVSDDSVDVRCRASASNWTQLVAVQTLTARPAAWAASSTSISQVPSSKNRRRPSPGQLRPGDRVPRRVDRLAIVPARDLEAGLEVVPHQRCRGVVGDLAQRRDRPPRKRTRRAVRRRRRHNRRRRARRTAATPRGARRVRAGESDSPTRRSDRPGFFSSTLRPTVLGTASSTSASVGTAASVPSTRVSRSSASGVSQTSPRRRSVAGRHGSPRGARRGSRPGSRRRPADIDLEHRAVSSRSAARVTASIVFSGATPA